MSRLLSLRKELDLTQREFAKKVGISQAHLCRLEKSEVVPRPSAIKVQRALGLSELETAQLILGKGKRGSA